MNSGKIVAGRVDGRKEGEIEGSTRGPRGPKNESVKWTLPILAVILNLDTHVYKNDINI